MLEPRVLCIACHPDDEVLGVGGTLLRHKAEGRPIWVVLASRCRTESEVESHEAEARMGIEYERLWETGRTVADAINDYMPDIVYTHSMADLHHEHRALHEQVLVATRPGSGVKAIYAFETPSATDWGHHPFIPQRFVSITDVVEEKMHIMEAYASELREVPHPRNIDSLYSRGIYWGQRAGFDYAEPFEVIRQCW